MREQATVPVTALEIPLAEQRPMFPEDGWRRKAAAVVAGAGMLLVSSAYAPSTERQDDPRKDTHSAPGTYSETGVVKPAAVFAPQAPAASKPNILLVMADDMSTKDLRHMPRTRNLVFNQGATFDNHIVNLSMCCPSRVSMLTGKYAHNTGLDSNAWPDGFYGALKGGLLNQGFQMTLRRSGYTTSLMGKFLNGYTSDPQYKGKKVPSTFVPSGWSDWAVPVKGQYKGTKYRINVNGKMYNKKKKRDFLADFTTRRAVNMIKANKDRQGLFMEVTDYGPHVPEPASPIERRNKKLKAAAGKVYYPRTPDFNEANVSDKPAAVRSRARLSPGQVVAVDKKERRRFMSLRTLDRHVGQLVQALRKTGQLANTYVIFTSDNGYHMGEHRITEGKNTGYDTDIRVPLGIRGPGTKAGTRVSQPTSNVDIAPTVIDMAGKTPPASMDGESMRPLAQRLTVPRTDYVFFQKGYNIKYGSGNRGMEPGARNAARVERSIPRFIGAASRRYRLVVYGNGSGQPIPARINGMAFRPGEREFYDMASDPYQIRNLTSVPREQWTAAQTRDYQRISAALLELAGCRGAVDCRVND